MNESGHPVVSILIPVYNREKIIEETIDSALRQTYVDFEIIIVDNCSTDQTYQVISDKYSENAKVQIYQNESNLGPVRNWLKCLEYSKGTFVKFLWSDDWVADDFLEKTLKYMQQEDVAFAYSPAYIVDGNLNTLAYDLFGRDKIYSSKEFIKLSVLEGNVPVSPGCAIFRRQDVIENLIIDVPNEDSLNFNQYGAGNDMLLFLLAACKYPSVAIVSSTSSYFRAHKGSFSCSNNLGLYYDWARYYYLSEFQNRRLLKAFKVNVLSKFYKHKQEEYISLNRTIQIKPSLLYINTLIIRKVFYRIKDIVLMAFG